MGKFNHLVNNFKSGEFSPKMSARTEVEEYNSSCEKIVNMFPMKQGGATQRGGLKYIHRIFEPNPLQGDGKARSIPFIFSKKEAYHITLHPSNLVPAPASVTDRTNVLGKGDDPTLFHTIPASNFIVVTKNTGVPAVVTGDLGNTWENITTYTDASAKFNELFHYAPFFKGQFKLAGADARGFHYAQSGDIMLLTHDSGEIPPIIVARTAEDTFEVEWFHKFRLRTFFGLDQTKHYYTNILRIPFLNPNISDTTIKGTRIDTHRIDIAPSGGPAINFGDVNLYDTYLLESNKPIFTEAKLGSTFKVEALVGVAINTIDFVVVDVDYPQPPSGNPLENSPYVCLAITARYHTTDFTVNAFDGPFPDNVATTAPAVFAATDSWSESAWDDDQGFPKSCCFFEQRAIFGGNKKLVDTMWGSRTGNIYVMLATRFTQDGAGIDKTNLNNFVPVNIPDKDKVVDIFGAVNLETDPISFKPSSNEINTIQWLSSGQALMIGTLGAEYVVSGGNKALSATSVSFRRQTTRGGSPIMPVRADDEVIYILRDGRAAYNFKFSERNGSFLSNEVTLHADHIVDVNTFEDPVADRQFRVLEYCTTRNIILAVTTNDELVGFTYSPANGVMAWHRFPLGAKVHGAVAIPSANGDVDEIWMTIERFIDGERRLHIEKIGKDFLATTLDNVDDIPNFLDSSKILVGVNDTINMDHLEGEEVHIYVDGIYDSKAVVNGGTVTATKDSTKFLVAGIPYEAYIETNDLNAGGAFGTSKGLTQRIDRLQVLLYKTRSAKAGHTDGKIDSVKGLNGELSTGTYPLDFPQGPSEDGAKIKIEADGAYPFTVLGVVARGQTNDR
jgi:hypothetical protein